MDLRRRELDIFPSRKETWIVIKLFSFARLSANRAALALALASHSAGAQTPSSQPVPRVSFRYEQVHAAGGTPKPGIVIHVELQPGWHINSEAPLDSFLVPTTVEAQAEGMEFGAPIYPPAVRQHSEVMGGDLALFTGAFDISIPAQRPAASGMKGKTAAKQPPPRTRVTLNYQACNNAMCYPPKAVTVEQ